MNQKDRKKLQALLRDAQEKSEKWSGETTPDYYKGVAFALNFVLTEV